MQQRYGLQCPDFQETSWQDAAIQAHRQFKFLFVYLHSPDHEVSFIRTEKLFSSMNCKPAGSTECRLVSSTDCHSVMLQHKHGA